MFENTRRTRRVLAGVAGVNLALALAVSAGAVPRPGADSGARSAETVASAAFAQDAVASARQPGDSSSAARQAPTTAAPTTAVPTTGAGTTAAPTTAVTKPTVTTAPATTKPAAVKATTSPVAAQVAAPTIPPVTVPAVVTVARRVPSTAEVQGALSSLPTYVHSILTPSPAQVAQLGDKVCTMFDQGQTVAQVKATGLQMVTQIPLTTILPGGADWVVRTVVTLYCPGHLSKLG